MRRIALSAFLILTACGTSPDPNFYALATVDGTANVSTEVTIRVLRPILPGYLDRADFVVQDNHYALSIDERNNWAEALDKMFARVLTADLMQRLPQSQIWTGDEVDTSPRFTVAVNATRFNALSNGSVRLKDTFSITDTQASSPAPAVAFSLDLSAGSSGGSIADGLSRLVAKQADAIADTISRSAATAEPQPQH